MTCISVLHIWVLFLLCGIVYSKKFYIEIDEKIDGQSIDPREEIKDLE